MGIVLVIFLNGRGYYTYQHNTHQKTEQNTGSLKDRGYSKRGISQLITVAARSIKYPRNGQPNKKGNNKKYPEINIGSRLFYGKP